VNIKLKRPLVFFDLETTGLRISDARIIEISIIKVFPEQKTSEHTTRINPTVPIPPQSTEIHGITDDDVKNKPTFKNISSKLFSFLYDCDLVGYNSNNYDIPILAEEFLRTGFYFDLTDRKMIDVQSIYHQMEPRNLKAAYKFYCQKDLEGAHSAKADTKATFEVLQAQLKTYDSLESSLDFLHAMCERKRKVDHVGKVVFDENDVKVFNFGKHFGKPVEQVIREYPDYFDWLLQEGQIPNYTKKILYDIRKELGETGQNTLF